MDKTTINIDAIDFLSFYPETESYIKWDTWYKTVFNWRRLKFQKEAQEEGYNTLRGGLKTYKEVLDLEPNVKIIDGKVYRKACVQITFRNQRILSKYFNTESEAEIYYQSLNRKLTNKTEL
jgi:hypothetical protein